LHIILDEDLGAFRLDGIGPLQSRVNAPSRGTMSAENHAAS
jgi:hypothetical protein